MSLRIKLLKKKVTGHISIKLGIIFILFLTIILIAGNLLISNVLTGSIDRLENLSVNERLMTVRRSYEKKLDYLKALATDWGIWDDSYEYMKSGDNEFIESNIPDSKYEKLDVDLIMFVDTSGKVVYGEKMDRSSLVKSQPDGLIYEDIKRICSESAAETLKSGVIILSGGPMMIATHPILKSSGEGPSRGIVIFGRFFDDNVADTMSENLGFKISYHVETHKNKGLIKGQEDGAGNYEKIAPQSKEFVEGYEFIPDIFNESDIVLKAEIPRDVHSIGSETAFYITLFMMLLAVFSLALLLLLINRFIIRRITKLQREVSSITGTKDISKRVALRGSHDEIYSLSEDINGMLEATEELNASLQKANSDLGLSVGELVTVNRALSEEKEKIEHLAYHDALTGLPNGVYFNDYLGRLIQANGRFNQISASEGRKKSRDISGKRKLAVLFIDLDGFKMINDSMGHAAGDALLISVSKRLLKTARKSDFISRIGGDEFLMIIDTPRDIAGLEALASRMLKKLAEPYVIDGQECYISASIGIVVCPDDGNTAEELTKNADLAMYKAKEKGKNRYCFFSNEMRDRVVENMALSNQLWRAAERNELELYYQPQVSCYTNEITGIEALMRWNHPERGLVMPDKFIPLAEQTGAIIPMGEWVLNEACAKCKEWQDKYCPDLRVSVNVSVKQLQNEGIIKQVEKALSKTGINPPKLEIEVTESILMKEADSVIKTLEELKILGVHIAIDDFGTEYSSLNYLKQMPVDRLKIAMQFVQGIEANEKDQAVAKATIILAKNMGMLVVAEGVETRRQYDFLVRHSCDDIQGYYMYKPMKAEDLEKVLKTKFGEK